LVRLFLGQALRFAIVARLLHVRFEEFDFVECDQFVLFGPDDEDGDIVRELGDRVECSFVGFLDAADVRVDTEPAVFG
jgi:hypothetical protein